MRFVIRCAIFILIGILTTKVVLAGPQKVSAFVGDPTAGGDFQVSTAIALNFNGLQQSTTYKLVDELGLEYDVMSLLNKPGVGDEVGLDEEQMMELRITAQRATQEISKKVVGAIASEDGRSEIETMFRDLQDELYVQMDVEQIALLKSARDRMGVEEFGFEKYFATSLMQERLGLSTEQVDSLKQLDQAKQSLLEKANNRIKEANLELLQQLSETQLQSFEDLIGQSNRPTFLESKLLTSEKSQLEKRPRNYAEMIKFIGDRKLRDKLAITTEQFEALKLVRRHARTTEGTEIATALKEHLNPDQFKELTRLTIMKQVSKLGTIESLCFGLAGVETGITTEQAEKLHAAGQQICAELESDLNAAKVSLIRESLGTFEPGQLETLAHVAEQVDLFKAFK